MGNATECVTLPTELDIKAASPLANQLLALRGRDVLLNASQIERVGAQCLQVLLSAASTWRTDGSSLAISEPSPAFTDAIEIAGLELSNFTSRNH
ncbi:STAS domain-containing protein [Aquamicrobium zhengzhouense]|uniref:STAS domain-containing protein n=1 Tax=Aquamicrobium zhengzhouense TaxID=2781738 RepID=A0ABS0SFZ8_9HYPH|nr:STAS domain-containing protein [Aquamicrobium zhengzhouense]MBI1622233.1 STAS domain-containing protein [Aquamicrobium zhengzhouense]